MYMYLGMCGTHTRANCTQCSWCYQYSWCMLWIVIPELDEPTCHVPVYTVRLCILLFHLIITYFGTCTMLMLKGEVPHPCQLYVCTHISGYVNYFSLTSPVVSQVYLLPWHIALITISALALLVASVIILTRMFAVCGCKLIYLSYSRFLL